LSFNDGRFERTGVFIGEMNKFEIQRQIRFNTRDGQTPLDTPKCGFLGEKCKKLRKWIFTVIRFIFARNG
jgi:uncharacterized C2H2 Zn-finger protein